MKNLLMIIVLCSSHFYASDINPTHLQQLEKEQSDLQRKVISNHRMYRSSFCFALAGSCMNLVAENNEKAKILGLLSALAGSVFLGDAIGRREGLEQEYATVTKFLREEQLRLESHSNNSDADEEDSHFISNPIVGDQQV